MAIGGKHFALVALVTLLLTYAAFQGKSSFAHAKSVSVVGRKGLAEPRSESSAALFADESTTTSEDTLEEQTSEESDQQILDEQTFEEQTSEEVTEIVSEEVSDELIEPSREDSTVEETSSEETTAVEDSWSEYVQAQENVEFSTGASEEVPYEGSQMREMEEVMPPQAAPAADNSAAPPRTTIENPDRRNYPEPQDDPSVFLRNIARDNALAKQNERLIQACIKEEGCGTPE